MKRLMLALFIGALSALTIAAPASAITATFTGGPNITAVSNGQVRTAISLGTLACNVTLTGTVNPGTYTTNPPALVAIGSVTGGSLSNCTFNGSPTTVTLQGLPWTIAATSATAFLRDAGGNITGILPIVILGVTFFSSATGCTFRGNVNTLIGQAVSGVNPLTILPSVLSGGCGNGTLTGSFNVTGRTSGGAASPIVIR